MNEKVRSEVLKLEKPAVRANTSKLRWRRLILSPLLCSGASAVGIFGGISALFIGLVCVLVHGLMAGDTSFDRVGTVLLIASIPMILVGSIFLDEIER